MSDTSTPTSEELDSSTETEGAPDGETKAKAKDTEFVPRSELEKAAKRRDKALEEKRELEKRVSELSGQVSTFGDKLKELDDLKRKAEDDDAVKRGDIEKLRKSASDTEASLNTKIAELTAELERTRSDSKSSLESFKSTYILKAEVMRILSETTTDPELAYLALSNHFELAEDEDGNFTVQVKDSTSDPRTFVERTLEKSNRAVLLKNQRKSGAGTEQTSAKEKTGGTKFKTLEEINAMPDRGAQYFRENPDAAKAVLGGLKLS
jgi:hypothetical protein